jgi:hypothetical protein
MFIQANIGRVYVSLGAFLQLFQVVLSANRIPEAHWCNPIVGKKLRRKDDG